jgi:hypothetical protein
MKQYQRALMAAHKITKQEVKAYNHVFNLQRAAAKPDVSKQYYYYDSGKFIQDTDFVYGLYIDAYLNARDTSVVTDEDLKTSSGREEFVKEMHDPKFMASLRAKYPNNSIIRDLSLENTKSGDGARLRLHDFYDMTDDMRAQYMEDMGNIDRFDRKKLFIYNLITTREKTSRGSLTSFFSSGDKADFNSFLDQELVMEQDDINSVHKAVEEKKRKGKGASELYIPYSTSFKVQEGTIRSTKPYKNIELMDVSYIRTQTLDPTPVKRAVVNGKDVIYRDVRALQTAFHNKIWTSPKKTADGTLVPALPLTAFATAEEFGKFLVEYEYLRAMDSMEMSEAELMEQALKNVGKQALVKYKTNEKNKQDAKNCGIK